MVGFKFHTGEMGEVMNGEDSTNMYDIFQRRRALRRCQNSGYDPSKKSESLFGRRIDDFKHFMHKDDLKKLYPNSDSVSPKTRLLNLSRPYSRGDIELYMNKTAEITPCTSMNDLTCHINQSTKRRSSLPAPNSSCQSMNLSGSDSDPDSGSGSSPSTTGGFNVCNENRFLEMEGTMSCAAPVSQIPPVHSMSGKGTELARDFTVLEKKLITHHCTFGPVDQEYAALESVNVTSSVPSSHVTTPLDTGKPAEEPVESPIKETEAQISQQNSRAEGDDAKLKVSCTPEV